MVDRFLATVESNAHPKYKQQIIEAGTDGTQFADYFGRAQWPGGSRVLRTPFFETLKNEIGPEENENDQPVISKSVVFGKVSTLTHSFHFT